MVTGSSSSSSSSSSGEGLGSRGGYGYETGEGGGRGHHNQTQASQPPSETEKEELRKGLDEIARVLSKAPKLSQPAVPPPSSSNSSSGNIDPAHAKNEPNNTLVPPTAAAATAAAATAGAASAAAEEDDLQEQLHAAKSLRHLLSTHREVLIHEVHDKNWIPCLLGWLRLSHCPPIQVEALWALTNIAAGNTENTGMLLKHNPIPALVSLLDSPNEEVLEQAVWVIGNIAGEGASSRDIVLSNHALPPLVQCILSHQQSQQILRIGSWALNNLCDSQPRPALDIHILMPVLHALLRSEDSEVLSHTCWALSHLCDGPSTHIKVVVEASLCGRLVQLLQHRSWRVIKPALRTIGNIVCAEDEVDYTQSILEAGAVPHLKILIGHSNREIQKEACWTLSNIAAGTCEQIQTVLDSGAIPLLVSLALQPADMTDAEVRSEACWVVLNATSCGSDSQIEFLVKEGCIGVLSDLLGESNMVMMALEGLERILQVGEDEGLRLGTANPYACMLSPWKIEELESHKQLGIAKRAGRIWKEHFVTCAICNRTFSKQAPEVRFCGECKCFVCGGCNCMVFHLSYQEELWMEMSVKEASAKEALMATATASATAATAATAPPPKAGGRDGEVKAAEIKALGATGTAAAGGTRAALGEGGRRGRDRDEGAEEGGVETASTRRSGDGGMVRKAPGGTKTNHSPASSSTSVPAPATVHEEAAPMNGGGSKRRGRNRGNAGGEEAMVAPVSVKSESAAPTSAHATGSGKAVGAAATTDASAGKSEKKMDAGVAGAIGGGEECGDGANGIDLVDYLQSTGSIIALSKFLDQEDGGDHDEDGGNTDGLFG
ncbi:importin subunit [Nannochloropsis oceanica]